MIFDTGCFNMTVELSNTEDMMKVYKVYHMFSQIYRPPHYNPHGYPCDLINIFCYATVSDQWWHNNWNSETGKGGWSYEEALGSRC